MSHILAEHPSKLRRSRRRNWLTAAILLLVPALIACVLRADASFETSDGANVETTTEPIATDVSTTRLLATVTENSTPISTQDDAQDDDDTNDSNSARPDLGDQDSGDQDTSGDEVSGDDTTADDTENDADSQGDATDDGSDAEDDSTTEATAGGGHGESHSSKAVPLITNDAIILGILLLILGGVFWTSSRDSKFWKTFYKFVPMLLMCYFLPSLLTLFRVVDPDATQLYYVATRFLLPASLVLLTLSIDLREILRLGPKALIMFLTGTVGVVLGGPIAVLIVRIFNPDLVGGTGDEEVWKGLSTVAGSWIGGGANQAAMKEIYEPSDRIYSAMVAVDVLVAEVWMVFLLLGVGHAKKIDRIFRADSSSVESLRLKMESFSQKSARIPSATDLMVILAVVFGVTAYCHFLADAYAPWIDANFEFLHRFSLNSQFFWLIVLATTIGVAMSFTPVKQLEGAGASKVGTVFIFILVATIGLKMDIRAIVEYPGFFLVGGIWMLFHVILLLIVGFLIRAPYFFLAVGSKANIGGAASAPVVAASFHPSLAPVGVLLAVLGYALGTYGAWLCAIMMQEVSPL